MNKPPDNYEYTNHINGLPWYIAFGVPFLVLLLIGLSLANLVIKHYLTTAQ
jgi:hypothetical protein